MFCNGRVDELIGIQRVQQEESSRELAEQQQQQPAVMS